MRVFLTGASGFIGSAIVKELLGAGHQVLGLARSDASAALLEAAGAEVHRGNLEDLESLKRGAEASDGVIHAGYDHDFFHDTSGRDFYTLYLAAAETDRQAIEAMGLALAGSDRPLVITSGTATLAPDRLGTEEEGSHSGSVAAARGVSEDLALSMASRGVRASVVRLPPTVHGEGDRGFVPGLIQIARAKGVSGYVAEGLNRWPAVHRLDAALLFRLAVESAASGTRLHGAAEEGVPTREIATVIGRHLNVPTISVPLEAANEHFGALAFVIGLNNPTSSRLTRERLGWEPTRRDLIADLEQGFYFEAPRS